MLSARVVPAHTSSERCPPGLQRSCNTTVRVYFHRMQEMRNVSATAQQCQCVNPRDRVWVLGNMVIQINLSWF